MFYNIIAKLDHVFDFEEVSAHCDIPCKIYDPISAQIAVLTMIRMVDLLLEYSTVSDLSLNQQATINRLVTEKENHGSLVKHEIRVIWGDYFKEPQLSAYPELHELSHEIMLLASSAKQHVDRTTTLKLLDRVNHFTEIFWKTKGVETYTATCPYPPAEVLVYPKLIP